MSDRPYCEQIESAVLESYLKDGNALTIKQVASLVDFSESTVRKFIWDCTELRWTKIEIALHSRDYPMYVVGHRMIDAVLPERRMLRKLVNELRRAINGNAD